MLRTIVLIFVFVSINLFAQEVLDISVKGISDSKDEGAQKDRKEAIMDAKRQACEKAGLHIKAETTVENFQTVYDHIESQAEAVLLPGFQIIDIGYVADGTFQVVLSGKIKIGDQEEKIDAKELRYAKSLNDRGEYSKCKEILRKYIDDKEKDAPEALKEEALYLNIKWGYSFNIAENCEKYAAFYPESKRTPTLLKFTGFISNPILEYKKEFKSDNSLWIDAEFEFKSTKYDKKIHVVSDTIIFKDFAKNETTLLVDFNLYKTTDESVKQPSAYHLILSYFDGNIKKGYGEKELKTIDDRFKQFSRGGSKTFQHSSSGNWFKHFSLKYYQIKGDVPFESETFNQTVEFNILQTGF